MPTDLEAEYEAEFLRRPHKPLTREQLAIVLGLPIPEPEKPAFFNALRNLSGERKNP